MEIKHREINLLCFEFLCFFNQRKKYVKLRPTHNARDVNSPMIGPLKSEKNKTSYSHRTCCKAKSLKVLRNVLFKRAWFIYKFSLLHLLLPFSWLRFFPVFFSLCCKDLQQLLLRSVPFHVCRFLSAPLDAQHFEIHIHSKRYAQKVSQNKKHNRRKVSNASHRAIITQAKLMELFISLSAYTILFTLRNWKLKRRRENECFMKIRRWSQGHFALRPNENAICFPMKNLCRSN